MGTRGIMRTIVFQIFFVLALASGMASAQVVGRASIHAPAVLIQNNTGTLTVINLTVSKGNGNVRVIGPAIVANSTLQSAQTAAYYAAKYAGLRASSYNFTYSIMDAGSNVSGPSAGAAMTILAVSALTGRQLIPNFTITGTISQNGSIGEIGGVYDKSSAAKAGGMSFIIVPGTSDRQELELYLLVQDSFGIPLVQAANISQAAEYAFGYLNASGAGTSVNLYQNINPDSIQIIPYTCSNGCNMSGFADLADYTFSFTNSSIQSIPTSTMAGVVAQMKSAMSQYAQLENKGYLYAASNYAFNVYVDSFFFNNYLTNLGQAISVASSTQDYCSTISAPPITASNYEYVTAGELRQLWGYTTANLTYQALNYSSELTTDDILAYLSQVGEANAWCHAAAQMYALPDNGGQQLVPSNALAQIASERLLRAEPYGADMYYETAVQANLAQNYPVAILDADYAYANAYADLQYSRPTSQLIAMSQELAVNSTYGAWATQFANEAAYYVQESSSAPNATSAHSYAESAYFVALLASQISNDTANIYANLVPGNATPSLGIPVAITNSTSAPAPRHGAANGIEQATVNIVTGIQQLVLDIYIINIIDILLTLVLVVSVLMVLQALLKLIRLQQELGSAPQKPRQRKRATAE